jgi:hypothetical protein
MTEGFWMEKGDWKTVEDRNEHYSVFYILSVFGKERVGEKFPTLDTHPELVRDLDGAEIKRAKHGKGHKRYYKSDNAIALFLREYRAHFPLLHSPVSIRILSGI